MGTCRPCAPCSRARPAPTWRPRIPSTAGRPSIGPRTSARWGPDWTGPAGGEREGGGGRSRGGGSSSGGGGGGGEGEGEGGRRPRSRATRRHLCPLRALWREVPAAPLVSPQGMGRAGRAAALGFGPGPAAAAVGEAGVGPLTAGWWHLPSPHHSSPSPPAGGAAPFFFRCLLGKAADRGGPRFGNRAFTRRRAQRHRAVAAGGEEEEGQAHTPHTTTTTPGPLRLPRPSLSGAGEAAAAATPFRPTPHTRPLRRASCFVCRVSSWSLSSSGSAPGDLFCCGASVMTTDSLGVWEEAACACKALLCCLRYEKYIVVYTCADTSVELTALASLQCGKDQNMRSSY